MLSFLHHTSHILFCGATRLVGERCAPRLCRLVSGVRGEEGRRCFALHSCRFSDTKKPEFPALPAVLDDLSSTDSLTMSKTSLKLSPKQHKNASTASTISVTTIPGAKDVANVPFEVLPSPTKSKRDKKEYKVIRLGNGLTACLISDKVSFYLKKLNRCLFCNNKFYL